MKTMAYLTIAGCLSLAACASAPAPHCELADSSFPERRRETGVFCDEASSRATREIPGEPQGDSRRLCGHP
jgi:hypothetical protein